MTTAAVPPPRWFARARAALRATARALAEHLATDNGGFWAYGVWYPEMGPIVRTYPGAENR